MQNLIFILVFLLFSYTQAQETWVYENNYSVGRQILESYDGGTLILAIVEWQTGESKLVKLDRLGEVLWEHTLEEEDNGLLPLCMAEDRDGNVFIGGRTHKYTGTIKGDAFLLKLNACGELIWFVKHESEGYMNTTTNIFLDENSSIFILQQLGSCEGRFTLRKLNFQGEILWTKQHFQEIGGSPDGMIRTSDGGFVLNGTVYLPPYYDPDYPVTILRNAVVKTDSLGSEQWVNIYRWEEDTMDTIFISSGGGVQEIDSSGFIASTLDRNESNLRLSMYELNSNGEVLWNKIIAKPDTMYDKTKIILLHDSTLLIATSASLPESPYQRHLEVYKMDLQGNKIDEFVDNNNLLITSDFRLNSDSSSAFIMPAAPSITGNYSLYALKLNPYTMELDSFALEDDTEYDYFCPEGVVDQTINFPNLGVEDVFVKEKQQLRIAPNPAKNYTYVYFEIENYNRSAKIEIHNLQGQQICSYPTLASEGRLYQDLSSYSSGMYIVSLVLDNRVVETQQMVVE
jgi:outer membrane protein assembly factor BamB